MVVAMKAKDKINTIQDLLSSHSQRKCRPINRTPRPRSQFYRRQYCPGSTNPPMYRDTWHWLRMKLTTLEWGKAALILTPAARVRVASQRYPTSVTKHLGSKTQNHTSVQLTTPHASRDQPVTRVTLCCYSNGAGDRGQVRTL